MKTFKEFCDGVLREIPRATGNEKDNIRDELLDHLMEHRDMLIDHGFEPLEAEQRAIEAMGNPTEIGRSWNETLSPLWLWLGRVCMAAFLLLLLTSATDVLYKGERLLDALEVRYAENAGTRMDEMAGYDLVWSEDPGIQQQFGEHIIRIHRTELWQDRRVKDDYTLKVYYVTYHQSPWGESLNSGVFHALEYENAQYRGGGSSETAYATWKEDNLAVTPGQETVGIRLEHMGNLFTAQLNLDWGGAAA